MTLADPRISGVTAPGRRTLDAHPKLRAPLVDFDNLPADADWWRADAVICTLGTTIRKAGSQAAFRRVDYDYPLAVARLAKRHGTPVYALNSAIGANAGSRIFYNRVKGELERDLADVGFESLTHVRPGLIGGKRQEFRLGERVLVAGLTVFGFLLPRRWRINPADRIAAALIESAVNPKPGVHAIESAALVKQPKDF